MSHAMDGTSHPFPRRNRTGETEASRHELARLQPCPRVARGGHALDPRRGSFGLAGERCGDPGRTEPARCSGCRCAKPRVSLPASRNCSGSRSGSRSIRPLRAAGLDVLRRIRASAGGPLHLAIDSPPIRLGGLKVFGEGAWKIGLHGRTSAGCGCHAASGGRYDDRRDPGA